MEFLRSSSSTPAVRPRPYASQLANLTLESLTTRGIDHREPFDLIDELRERNLFDVRGERMTEPVLQEQTVDDFVESIHARTNFSRERMGAESAAEYDSRAKEILLRAYPTGSLTMSVQMRVVWAGRKKASWQSTAVTPKVENSAALRAA